MKFSILIPTYDRPAKLRRAVASCLQQDFPSLEILVVDNGKNPQTPLVVSEFDGVRYLQSEPFKVRPALALGIESATGDWLVPLDDDDFLTPGRLESDALLLQDLPSDVIVLLHDFLRVDYFRSMVWLHQPDGRCLDLFDAFTVTNIPPPGAATWRLDALQKHHPFALEGGWNDIDLYASALRFGKARAAHRFGFVQDDTRVSGRQTTTPREAVRMIDIHRERYRPDWPLCNAPPGEVERVLTKHSAFYLGKNAGPFRLQRDDWPAVRREPLQFLFGCLSPLRARLCQICPELVPTLRGSRMLSLPAFQRQDPRLAAWIESNNLFRETPASEPALA